jgi:transcriptional regulator with XRE-family HTH domain
VLICWKRLAGFSAVINEDAHIRAALSARGIALKQVADACGISKGAVSQWFLSGPGWRPIPKRHMATIRQLLAASPSAPDGWNVARARKKVTSPAKATRSRPEPQLAMPQPLAVPARWRRRTPPRTPPHPMHWGAPPFLGVEPSPRTPMHYPGHWASPPVMPPPPPAYVSPAAGPAAGPQHAVIVAAHNRVSQLAERRDVRSPEHAAEFPLGQFFGLTGPIGREDREAFEGQLTLYAAENGFAGEPELQQLIEVLRAAVRSHNRKFGYQETF